MPELGGEVLVALVTLTAMEIVLGIDNVVFISILTGRLPTEQAALARRLGLSLALLMRIGLLLAISWVMSLTQPLFVLVRPFSGRDPILPGGGRGRSCEGGGRSPRCPRPRPRGARS